MDMGNHFVDAGVLTIEEESKLGLQPGTYFAIMSHSGSRGVGATIANHYSRLAMEGLNLPRSHRHKETWQGKEVHHSSQRSHTSSQGRAGRRPRQPGAYKNIRHVLAAQTDLVKPIATFLPKLVLMAD